MSKNKILFLYSVFFLQILCSQNAKCAEPAWPSAYTVWLFDFEEGQIEDFWEDYGDGNIVISTSASYPPGSMGLAVDVSGRDQFYLQRYNLTDWPHHEFKRDTYVRFQFNPNSVTIPQGQTISLVRMRDGDWNVMAGLRLKQDGVTSYSLLLELPDEEIDSASIPIDDGWHTIVLGCRMHDWVGMWVDGENSSVHNGVQHNADFVRVLLIGKPDGNWSGEVPSGTVFFDNIELLFASYSDLWVDSINGSDDAEGTTIDQPLKTISMAADLASPGTIVHIKPGDYRESISLPVSGLPDKPTKFAASEGRGTVRLLGSESASSFSWTRVTQEGEIELPPGINLTSATIWKADISSLGLEEPPKFVAIRKSDENMQRLPLAREPDWNVQTEWKYHEYWWAADGGSDITTCNPAEEPDCDFPERSGDTLIDLTTDTEPLGIESGSLATLTDRGDITGATIYVKDNWSGHYTYRRRIAEILERGKIRVEKLPEGYTEGCWFDHDPSNPALGWNSKYFVEGLSKFMDNPGEWFYNTETGVIYIWTPDGRNPAEEGIEISSRGTGIDLSHRSNVEIVDLDIMFFEGEGIKISNSDSGRDWSYNIILKGLNIGWCTRGMFIGQAPGKDSTEGSQIKHLVLRDSRIHDIDSLGIFTWAGRRDEVVRAGITDFLIFHNEFDHIGFRDNEQGGGVGLSFHLADHLLFEGNHVHHIAHNGVNFSQALTKSDKGYDLPPEDIITGDILVKSNLFEDCVQNAGDAGGLKFWGATSDHSDTFRDVLVYGNVSRNNIGWTWVAEKRHNWMYKGKGGMGYYIDFAGGIFFFRNIAYFNGLAGFMASGSWVDQSVILANNTIVSSPYGYDIGVRGGYTSTPVGLDIVNTIFLNSNRFAIVLGDSNIAKGPIVIDYNLYYMNGWEEWQYHTPGILAGHVTDDSYREYPLIADVQSAGFEKNGLEGDPKLADFDPSIQDGSWQDFRLTAESTLAIDNGMELPSKLSLLLEKFGISDGKKGNALDRGAIEFDPNNPDAPYVIDVGPTDGTPSIESPWSIGYCEEPPEEEPHPSSNGGGCGCSIVS